MNNEEIKITKESKKFGMTKDELLEYYDSLSVTELKKFRLGSKQRDINSWKYKLHLAIANLLVIVLVIFSFFPSSVFAIIIGGVVSFGLILYSIRCYNYIRGEQLLYRMMISFYKTIRD